MAGFQMNNDFFVCFVSMYAYGAIINNILHVYQYIFHVFISLPTAIQSVLDNKLLLPTLEFYYKLSFNIVAEI